MLLTNYVSGCLLQLPVLSPKGLGLLPQAKVRCPGVRSSAIVGARLLVLAIVRLLVLAIVRRVVRNLISDRAAKRRNGWSDGDRAAKRRGNGWSDGDRAAKRRGNGWSDGERAAKRRNGWSDAAKHRNGWSEDDAESLRDLALDVRPNDARVPTQVWQSRMHNAKAEAVTHAEAICDLIEDTL